MREKYYEPSIIKRPRRQGKLICEFNNIKTSLGMIKLLRPIDSVKDRFKLRNSLFND